MDNHKISLRGVALSKEALEEKYGFELSEDERKVMNTFIRAGVMTKDEYISQVKAMRGAQ